ncbi:hypothetical protein HNV12_06510 [Methanococcoides sp. SA1]|nr:hypothetical protein [Methanococcoides sp. SA1]
MSAAAIPSFYEPLRPGMTGQSVAGTWLEKSIPVVRQFLHDRDRNLSISDFGRSLNGDLTLGYEVVYDYTVPNHVKREWIREWLTDGSNIISLIGKRGGGKTGTAFAILEMFMQAGFKVCIVGPPQAVPPGIERFSKLSDVPPGYVVFIDEIGIRFNSRQSGSKDQIADLSLLPTLRHTDRTLLVAAQLAALGDVNFSRLSDMYIVKPMGLFSASMDRDVISQYIPEMFMPVTREVSHVFCNEFRCNIEFGLPSFWEPVYSTPYTILDPDQVIDYIVELVGDDFEVSNIINEVWLRSNNMKRSEIQDLIQQIESAA